MGNRFNYLVRALIIAVCPVLHLLAPTTAADDLDNVRFEGTVTDARGDPIAGATIRFEHTATRAGHTAISDANGRYRIIMPGSGTYTARARASSFAEVERRNITAQAGQTIKLDFQLDPAPLATEVIIKESGAGAIDVTRTVMGGTLRQAELEQLPINGRNTLELVFLFSQVGEEPLSERDLVEGNQFRRTPEEAGIFSLNGAPAFSNNLTIDGLDNNDDRAARERISLSPDAVEELQVISNQYAAEYGRASGGRINLRTRSGSSDLRGRAFFYFQDESLNANDFFRNARGLKRLPFQRRQAGATMGGPIKRVLKPGRAFFFASFERDDLPDEATIDTLVPVSQNPRFPLPAPNQNDVRLDPSGAQVATLRQDVSTPARRNLITSRTDFNLAERHSLTARFDLARGRNQRGFSGGRRLIETITSQGRDSADIALMHNFILSPSRINQARFQFSRLSPRNGPPNSGPVVLIDIEGNGGALVAGSSTLGGSLRREDRYQWQNSLGWQTGPHLLKTGFDLQLISSSFTDLEDSTGTFSFDTPVDFLSNRPSRFVRRFNTESRLNNTVLGAFVQDEWRVKPDFTLSLGLRYDFESALRRDNNNFSPRIAFAWSPSKSDRTALRAGFGIFYNRVLLRTFDDFFLTSSAVMVDSNLTPEVLGAVSFPDAALDRAMIERSGVRESQFLRRVDPATIIPYTTQASFAIEREIRKDLVVELSYNFTGGVHLWRETNINAPILPAGFKNFTEYLLSRDFDNRPDSSGKRPITSTGNADIVRFDLGASSGASISIFGIAGRLFGLNNPSTSSNSAALRAALAAIRHLRPDPGLEQVEQLESSGNSFYHGGTLTANYRLGPWASLRASYTLSKTIDEGVVNTSSAQDLNNRRAERALSLIDQRHRFSFSGLFRLPYLKLEVAPIVRLSSARPFNISAGGVDRNLNDINNDRPAMLRDTGAINFRRPGGPPSNVANALALAPIGSSGNLPRNIGRGPAGQSVDFRLSRSVRLSEKVRLRPQVDLFNAFNNTVFSFGSEFINRNDDDFLVPRRTRKPRIIQLSLRLDL